MLSRNVCRSWRRLAGWQKAGKRCKRLVAAQQGGAACLQVSSSHTIYGKGGAPRLESSHWPGVVRPHPFGVNQA